MMTGNQHQQEILEVMAFQEAAGRAQHGLCHRSRLCRLPVGSWQADMIRRAARMVQAQTPADFRLAMQNPEAPVVFLASGAMVTSEIIERICVESPLGKMIVWETDEEAA